jgi:hypothetical protein
MTDSMKAPGPHSHASSVTAYPQLLKLPYGDESMLFCGKVRNSLLPRSMG